MPSQPHQVSQKHSPAPISKIQVGKLGDSATDDPLRTLSSISQSGIYVTDLLIMTFDN